MRTRYVMRNGELVPKELAPPRHTHGRSVHSLSDIAEFTTQEGTAITSRSQLREYERKNGLRQVGNDWTGSQRPAFWDMHLERMKGSKIEPR